MQWTVLRVSEPHAQSHPNGAQGARARVRGFIRWRRRYLIRSSSIRTVASGLLACPIIAGLPGKSETLPNPAEGPNPMRRPHAAVPLAFSTIAQLKSRASSP